MRSKIWILSLGLLLAACSGVKDASSGGNGGNGSSGQQSGGGTGSVSLTGLSVTPPSATIATTGTVSLSATGTYSDNSTKDLTSSVIWSSSDNTVATVSASGVITGVAHGSATITAQSGNFSGSSALTVNSPGPSLTTITISPSGASLPPNTTLQLTATGNYSDGSTKDVTLLVIWSSSTMANATVDGSGVVKGVAAGSSTITATLGSVMGSTSVTVNSLSITGISISPNDMTVPIGVGEQYTASAIYSDGSIQDLVSGVTWSSSSMSVATVDSNGLAKTIAAGTTTITATVGAYTDWSVITVVPAHLQTITLTPATATLATGTQQQFTATGNFDDGSTQVLTSAQWSSSTTSVLTIDQNGLATGAGPGASTISVVSGGISATASATVTSAVLTSLTIAPLDSQMPVGAVKQFSAIGTFSDNSQQDVTPLVLWSSSNATVATIDNTGLATSFATGTTTISATWGTTTQSTTLTVSNVTLVSITIHPANPQIAKGTSLKFTAMGTYSDGSTATLTNVSWRSSKNNLANIRGSGILHAKKTGTVTVTASASSISGSTTVTIGSGTLVSIVLQPANALVGVGTTQQFAAIGTFSDGSTQDVTINSHWSSSIPSVATIANAPINAGLATTFAAGTTKVGVNHGGIIATTQFSAQ